VDKIRFEFDKDTDEFLKALKTFNTRNVYRAGLKQFQEFYKKTPKYFLDALEEDQKRPRREKKRVGENTFREFVEWLTAKGLSPKSIRAYIAAVQSFAAYFGIKVTTKYVALPDAAAISKKFPWTIETITKLMNLIEYPELKSMSVTLFQSGISIKDLRKLTYSDIKYEYEHKTVPLCLDLTRHKTKVPFLTFIGSWGDRLLREHLQGHKLKLDTPLYTISHHQIDYKFRTLAKEFVGEYNGRNPIRPHTLRAAFRTLLGDAGMDRDAVKFMMGQALPEQDKVYLSRSRQGWRMLYQKNEHALTPEGL